MDFVGYIIPFDPEKYQNKKQHKKGLGYSENPLILCTVGGTSIGRRLIELCGKSYEILRESIEGLQMIVVAGPSIDKTTLSLPEGIEIHGYVSNFVDYMAASDLVVTQAGGGTTLELSALNKAFIYFPVEGHFEQEVHVSNRLMRHEVGTRMILSDTSPELLAEKILCQIGSTPIYDLPVDGAVRAARLISSFL
jgi:UDP-N-acetylglucosamine:LPS N-acetylglucosamine transferase